MDLPIKPGQNQRPLVATTVLRNISHTASPSVYHNYHPFKYPPGPTQPLNPTLILNPVLQIANKSC